MADHLSVDVLASNTDFNFVDNASQILRAAQRDFKLVEFEICLLLNRGLEAFEEFDLIMGRLLSTREPIVLSCSLELGRLV